MNKRITFGLLLITVVALLAAPGAFALGGYLNDFNAQYKTAGTRLDTCGICHINPGGGGPRNPYGTDYANNGHSFTAIESLDSDKDGYSNIAEIKALTFPGDPNDHPASIPVAPSIVSFSPASPITDNVGAARTFSVTADQTVDVTWYINGTQVFKETGITTSTYTNTSAVPGTWNVSATATNANGTAIHKWDWIVTTLTSAPTNAKVTFAVTDSLTGLPIRGAKVSMEAIKTKRTGGRNGGVVFSEVPLGNYKYTVQKRGYSQITGSVTVTGDTAVQVNLMPTAKSHGNKRLTVFPFLWKPWADSIKSVLFTEEEEHTEE